MFTGVLVNFATVVAGSLIGILFKKWLNPKYHVALINAIALGVIGIGAAYAIKTGNILVMVISLILGTLIGTFFRLDDRLEALGNKLQDRLKNTQETFSEGFAGASILFCVGSMAIMGCLECGLHSDGGILFTKSVMDGVASIFLAATMGVGVLFSAFTVLVYEGLLTLLFSLFAGGLDMAVINEISAVGGVILIGIAVNMLGLKKIKTADMVISLFMPLAVLPVLHLLGA